MRRSRRPLLILALALLAGCATDVERRDPQASLAAFGVGGSPGAAPPAVDAEQIGALLADLQDPPGGVRLAVVEVGNDADLQVAWPVRAAPLAAFRTACGGPRPFHDVVTLPADALPAEVELSRLRYAAARLGARQLLLVTRATERYDINNGWSTLYWTGLGLLIAPGNTLEVDTLGRAALLDVVGGRVLREVEARVTTVTRVVPLADNHRWMGSLLAENTADVYARLAEALAGTR